MIYKLVLGSFKFWTFEKIIYILKYELHFYISFIIMKMERFRNLHDWETSDIKGGTRQYIDEFV